MSCEFAHHDGSYVLGALSPAERRSYEQHLSTCAECARSVRELAGLPGLLSRVDSSALETPPPRRPVPDTLLPTLVDRVRRTRRRRAFVTAGVAAAAAVAAVTVGTLAVTGTVDNESTPGASTHGPSMSPTTTSTGPELQAMQPIGSVPVRASLMLESVSWGTRIDMTCTYVSDGGDYEPATEATYVLVIRTRDGRREPVGTWRAQSETTTRLSAATAAAIDQISSVEVQTERGQPVLRLTT
jgi:predicted anti-sigma-YlaC factor YlaD